MGKTVGIAEKITQLRAEPPVHGTASPAMDVSDAVENHALFMQMYKDLFNAGHGIFLWQPMSEALYFNSAYLLMLGYEEHTFGYHISTWENLIHPEDKDVTLSTQKKILESSLHGDSFESHYRLRMSTGEYRWFICKIFVVSRDENDNALFVVGAHIDLLAVNKDLTQHLVQHDRMHFALEAARDGLWDWDSQTNIVYYSPRYLEMLGYTTENFPPVFDSWACRVHPDDLNCTLGMQLAVASSPSAGDMFECIYRFLAADGTYKWILGRGKVTRRNSAGRATRIVGLHTDITELRNTQEALAKLVNIDPLTSLHSRFYFESELNKLRPSHHPISVIYCDIDCLKLVNDHIGHSAGDSLLTTAGQLIRNTIRSTDIAARLGGDEFIILLVRCPEYAAQKLLQALRDTLDKHNSTPGIMPIFMSLGLVSTEKNIPQRELVALADKAMIADKAKHRAKHLQATKSWIESQLNTTITTDDSRCCS